MSTINHSSRIVFVHVPKVAGSAMEHMEWVGDAGHRTASQLRRHMTPSQWEEYFSFAFVRDPVDRFISAYYHYLRRQAKPNEPRVYEELHDLVQGHQDERGLDGFVEEVDLDWLASTINHFKPQSFFVDEDLDFVGRYESLDADWRKVCELAGQPYVELPRTNAADREPGVVLSDEAKARIRRVYSEDLARWYGYFRTGEGV